MGDKISDSGSISDRHVSIAVPPVLVVFINTNL
jgi:hypothetical protein